MVNLSTIFEFPETNSGITKEFCQLNEGTIPVYASSKSDTSVLGYIKENMDGIKYYRDSITWNRNGSVGHFFIRTGIFTTNEDHRVLEIKDEFANDLDLQYLKYILEETISKLGYEYTNKLGKTRMRGIEIPIPIKDGGIFDKGKQHEIIQSYTPIFSIQQKIKDIYDEIQKCRVNLDSEYKFVELPLWRLFSIDRGSSYYTKKRIYGDDLVGEIPVYSSKTTDEGLLAKIKKEFVEKETDLHFEQCLTWTTDGYAGTIFIRNLSNTSNEKKDKYYFVITDHCGILKPLVPNLYLPFVKRILQPIFYDMAKGYGKKELKLNQVRNLEIKLPIDSQGDFDVVKQVEVERMYQNVEKLKNNFINRLEDILKHKIIFT